MQTNHPRTAAVLGGHAGGASLKGVIQTLTNITFVSAEGEETTIDAEDGESIMDVAINNFIDGIVAECGGACACATCQIYLDETSFAKVGGPDFKEESMLEHNEHRKPTSRLSCQLEVSPDLEGARLTLPESQY